MASNHHLQICPVELLPCGSLIATSSIIPEPEAKKKGGVGNREKEGFINYFSNMNPIKLTVIRLLTHFYTNPLITSSYLATISLTMKF